MAGTRITQVGPIGAPMMRAYGSFAGKPASPVTRPPITQMGPAGAPMMQRYGSFAGKPVTPVGHVDEWLARARRRGRR